MNSELDDMLNIADNGAFDDEMEAARAELAALRETADALRDLVATYQCCGFTDSGTNQYGGQVRPAIRCTMPGVYVCAAREPMFACETHRDHGDQQCEWNHAPALKRAVAVLTKVST